MVRGKKRILTYAERMGLEDEKKDLTALAKEGNSEGRSRGVDTESIKRQVAHLDREIKEGTAGRISGVSKDKMAGRSRELEDKIREGMPSRYEMDHPAKSPGAVRKHMSWDQRNKAAIKEYKDIQRRINPDAPANIEELRKDK